MNVNERDAEGSTPLIMARRAYKYRVDGSVEYLLR